MIETSLNRLEFDLKRMYQERITQLQNKISEQQHEILQFNNKSSIYQKTSFMTAETLYRIEELCTDGWNAVVEQNCTSLTREQCDQRLRELISEGYNPNSLRAIRES